MGFDTQDDSNGSAVSDALKALQSLGLIKSSQQDTSSKGIPISSDTSAPITFEPDKLTVPPDTTNTPTPTTPGSTINVPSLKPQKFADVAGATNEYNKSTQEEAQSDVGAATAKLNAEQVKNTRMVAVQDQYVKDLATADAQYQQKIEATHKQAAAETAAWMKDMDQRAAEKPDHSHWWHNTNLFSKALWLTSVAFSTMAESHGGKNVAKDMIGQAMEQDIKEQQESLNKKFQTGKERGTMLEKEQAQREGEVRDYYTHSVGRINSLLAANTVRAQGVSDADKTATYAAIDADLHQRKTQVALKRIDHATQDRLKAVEEEHTDHRELVKQKFEEGQHALDRKMHYDLAEEKIVAQIAKGKKNPEMFDFPSQSGIKLQVPNANGEKVDANFSVPKEMVKEATQIAQNGQAKTVALAGLRDAIKNNGNPYGVFSNDNEGRQRLAAVVDPLIRQMSGRFNKDTAKAMNDMILGEDPSSIMQRIKGMSNDDIVKMLDREIQEAPGSTKQQLLAIPGSNLADNPNADLVFTTPDTRGPKEHEYTGDEKITNATGKAPEPVELRNKDDIKNFGGEAEKQMPSELHNIIEEARTKLSEGFDKETTKEVVKQQLTKIDDWTSKHPTGVLQHNNAYALVDDVARRAAKAADELPKIKVKLTKDALTGDNVTAADVKKELDENNLTLSSTQIQKILDDIKSAKENYGNYTGFGKLNKKN